MKRYLARALDYGAAIMMLGVYGLTWGCAWADRASRKLEPRDPDGTEIAGDDSIPWRAPVAAALLVMLTACGVPPAPEPGTGKPPAKVLIFSAPWCAPCKQEVPEAFALAAAAKVPAVLYVETGGVPSNHPTPESALEYAKTLGLAGAEVYADPWRWKTYRRYYATESQLPAAVALDDAGELARKFYPGKVVEQLRYYFKGGR